MSTQGNYILYNPERTDYTITEAEFHRLEDSGSNLWKDICLVSFSVGVPCLINAIHDTQTPFVISIDLFLNYLFGGLGIALAIAWYKTRKRFADILDSIKKKPKMALALVSTASQAQDAQPSPVANATPVPPTQPDNPEPTS